MDKGEFKSFFLLAIFCLALGTSTLANGRDSSESNEDNNADDETKVCKCMEDIIGLKNCCKKEKINIKNIKQLKECTSSFHHCKDDSYKLTDEQTGVSVGLAVGLLFLGIAVGTIVTALICVFVPSLHRETDRVRRKITRRFHKSLKEDRYQTPEELDHSVTDNRQKKETTICNPKVPTAAVSLPGLDQAGYQVLDTVNRARYSHAYAGLQSGQPSGDGGGRSPEIQPIKLPKAFISPVYQEFTDNVILPGNEAKTKQNANSMNQKSKEENQPIKNVITSDPANHMYFVLEPQNEAKDVISSDNERPVSDHPYFVLEEQNA